MDQADAARHADLSPASWNRWGTFGRDRGPYYAIVLAWLLALLQQACCADAHMAYALRGVCCGCIPDFWHDRYSASKDWPDEYKEWYFRTLAWDVMYKYIAGLRAQRDALKEEGANSMHMRNMLLLKLPITAGLLMS